MSKADTLIRRFVMLMWAATAVVLALYFYAILTRDLGLLRATMAVTACYALAGIGLGLVAVRVRSRHPSSGRR